MIDRQSRMLLIWRSVFWWSHLWIVQTEVDRLKEGFLVPGKEKAYALRHELVLKPGDQLTF